MSVAPRPDDDPDLQQGMVTQQAKLVNIQARVRELTQQLSYSLSDRPDDFEAAVEALEWILVDTNNRVAAVENAARRAFCQRNEWAEAYDQLYQEYMRLADELGLLEE